MEPPYFLARHRLLAQPDDFESLCAGAADPRFKPLAVPHVPDVVVGRFDSRVTRSQARTNPDGNDDVIARCGSRPLAPCGSSEPVRLSYRAATASSNSRNAADGRG